MSNLRRVTSPTTGPTNPAQRQRWNDEHWTTLWPKRERYTDVVTPHLLDAVGLVDGERALDIGSGGGKTSIAAARQVGPGGTVTGADISTPLVELARRRAAEAGADNVAFEVVDIQHDRVAGAPFDVALSQFGVMFFDEPVTEFTNIASHLRPGGRLAFACWQSAEQNPFIVAASMALFLPAPPPPAAGKEPTGPFALADPDRTASILGDAGFAAIERRAIDITVDLPEAEVIDEDQLVLMGISETDLPAALRALDDQLGEFRVGDGLSRFPLSFQIFEARVR